MMKPFVLSQCKRVTSLRCPAVGRKTLSAAAAAATSSFSTSSVVGAGSASSKIYELRTYSIVPEKLGEFKQIFADHIHLRTQHSKLIGYWYTELGGVNETIHIWEYDSYAHRTAVRKALAEDHDWVGKCFSRILPMFSKQTNVILRAFPWYPPKLEPATGFGCYELKRLQVKPGLLSQLEHRMQQGLAERVAIPPAPLGFFYSEIGPIFSMYALGQYKDLDQLCEHRKEVLKNDEWRCTYGDMMKFLDGLEIKAMIPAPYSPLK